MLLENTIVNHSDIFGAISLPKEQKDRFYNQLIEDNVNIARYHYLSDAIDRLQLKQKFSKNVINITGYLKFEKIQIDDTYKTSVSLYFNQDDLAISSSMILNASFKNIKTVTSITSYNVSISDYTIKYSNSINSFNAFGGLIKVGDAIYSISDISVSDRIISSSLDEDDDTRIVNIDVSYNDGGIIYDSVYKSNKPIYTVSCDAEISIRNNYSNYSYNSKTDLLFASFESAINCIKDELYTSDVDSINNADVSLRYINKMPCITLLKDVTIDNLIYIDSDLDLNLSGHTITLGEFGSIRYHKNHKALNSENGNYFSITDDFKIERDTLDYHFYMYDGTIIYNGRPDNGELVYTAIDLLNCNDVIIYNVTFNNKFISKKLAYNVASSIENGLKLSYSNVWLDTCHFNNVLENVTTTSDNIETNVDLTVSNLSTSDMSPQSIIQIGKNKIIPFFTFKFYNSDNVQLGAGYDYYYTFGDISFNGAIDRSLLYISSTTQAFNDSPVNLGNRVFGTINYYDGTITLDEKLFYYDTSQDRYVPIVDKITFNCLSGIDLTILLTADNPLSMMNGRIASSISLSCCPEELSYRDYIGGGTFETRLINTAMYNDSVKNSVLINNCDIISEGSYDGGFSSIGANSINIKMNKTGVETINHCYPTIYYNLTAIQRNLYIINSNLYTRDCYFESSYDDVGKKSNWSILESILRTNLAGSVISISSNAFLVNTEGHSVRDGLATLTEAHQIFPGSNIPIVRYPIHTISGGFYSSSGHGGVYTVGSASFLHKNKEFYQLTDYHYSIGYTSSFVRPSNIIFRDAAFNRLVAKDETHYTGASGSGYWGYGSYNYFDNCKLGLLYDNLNQNSAAQVYNITGTTCIGETDVCYILFPTKTYDVLKMNANGQSASTAPHASKLYNEKSLEMITLKENYITQMQYTIPYKYVSSTPTPTQSAEINLLDTPSDGSISLKISFDGLFMPYYSPCDNDPPLFSVVLYKYNDINNESPIELFTVEELINSYVESTPDKYGHWLENKSFIIDEIYPGDKIVLMHQIRSSENDETIYCKPTVQLIDSSTSEPINPEVSLWDVLDTCAKYDKDGVVNITSSVNYKQGITNPTYGLYLKTIFIDPAEFSYIDSNGIKHIIPLPSRSTGFLSNCQLYGPTAFRNDYLSKQYIGENNKYGSLINNATSDFNALCETNPDLVITQKPNSANASIVITNKNYRKRLPKWKFYNS